MVGGRVHLGGGRRQGAGDADPAAPSRRDRDGRRRPISPRRCGASCSPAMARRRSTSPGLAVRTSLDPHAAGDRRPRRCATASIAYDRRHGWRGPVVHADRDRRRLAQAARRRCRSPAGADDAGWRLAVVLGAGAESATIGLGDGSTGLHPDRRAALGAQGARRRASGAGAEPGRRRAVTAGDVVLVEALAGRSRQGRPGSIATRCGRSRRCRARWWRMDPHTGRVLALTGGFSYEMQPVRPRDSGACASRARRSSRSSTWRRSITAITPSTLMLDAPVVIDQGPGLPKWRPEQLRAELFLGRPRCASASRNRATS